MKEQQKQWAKIVAKAWADDDYKQKLLATPESVLKAEGMQVPEGMKFKCVEATESQVWLVIPPKPSQGSVVEGEERLAAGYACSTGGDGISY